MWLGRKGPGGRRGPGLTVTAWGPGVVEGEAAERAHPTASVRPRPSPHPRPHGNGRPVLTVSTVVMAQLKSSSNCGPGFPVLKEGGLLFYYFFKIVPGVRVVGLVNKAKSCPLPIRRDLGSELSFPLPECGAHCCG